MSDTYIDGKGNRITPDKPKAPRPAVSPSTQIPSPPKPEPKPVVVRKP